MPLNLEKYKEQARKLEQKEQWAKALEQYASAVKEIDASSEATDADLAFYNRAGDIAAKLGKTQDAISFYERAVDKYHEVGLHNNAIALCNKVLRLAPGRAQTYLKLGMLFASKGFGTEAKANLLEYADRMQKAGQLDDAFRALKAFAEMTPGQEEIWATLAQQARASAKTPAQKEQVEKLLSEFEAKDKVIQQRRSRMSRHQITGEAIQEERAPKKGELIFLDLDEPPAPRKSKTAAKPPAPPAPPRRRTPPPEEPPPLVIQQTSLAVEEEPAPEEEIPPLEIQRTSLVEEAPEPAAVTGGELIIEPTSLAEAPPPPPPPPPPVAQAAPETVAELPEEIPEIEVPLPGAAPEDEVAPGAAIEGLPMLDMEEAAAGAAGPAEAIPAWEEAAPGAEEGALAAEAVEPAAAVADLDFLDVAEVAAPPTVEELHARVAANAGDWEAHRLLGEALIEQGGREDGLAELDVALDGLEQTGELDAAYQIAEEALRLEPNSVRHHQKRVELAYRQGDKSRLADAYLELADALLRSGEADKALAVYQRVLEHDPLSVRAKSAVDTLAPPPPPPDRKGAARASRPEPVTLETAGGTFVDLGAMLLEEEGPKDTRMRIQDEEPSGDEEKDFASMLTAFKKGIEENVDESDFQSHYDLGVAYKEMGLLDEAIAEFQKALRGADGRLKSSEALGLCFYEKGQFGVAETILKRGLDMPASGDAERVGLLYWLGRTLEEQAKVADALVYYNRVFAVDITFQDVSQRVKALSRAGA